MNTLKMSGKEIEKKSSLDYVQWNEADIVERSSSDRTYNPYDYAILQRLQFLTQRVEYLENKLENSLTSRHEDLSFGLSVNSRENIPNVDIKVLSGNKYDGEQIMDGWDDAVVERNTSFLIIPVGEAQDISADPNMIKQTLDLSLSPSLSPRRALNCSGAYENVIGDNDSKESIEQECKQQQQTNSISLQICPPPVKTFAYSSKQSSCYSNENAINVQDGLRGVPIDESTRKQHAGLSSNQETKPENIVSKLTTTPPKDSNNNYLKYGYTFSVSKSPVNANDSENDSLFDSPEDSNKIKVDSDNSVSLVNNFNDSHPQKNTTDNTGPYTNNQSRDDSICYQDVEICEVAQYEDKFDDNFDRTIDIKIQRRISKENCVYLPTSRIEPLSKQPKNAKNSQHDRDLISDRFRDEREMKRDESFESESDSMYSNDFEPKKVPFDQIRTKMQIYESKSQPYRGHYCLYDESDGRLIPEDKATPKDRLTHNNSQHNSSHYNGMNFSANNNTSTQREPKHYTINKPTIKKVRVRSVEIPSTTSSDDDLFSISSASELSTRYQRPQRRKPKKPAISYDLESRLRELIDPNQIGNVHEHIKASQRPLLLHTMSPSESGYVGSSANSPSDDWRDTSLTSVSTYERTPSRPDSPYASTGSYNTPGRSQSSSKGYVHDSVGSSLSDDVFIKKTSKPIHDSSFSIGNSRLNEVLPGPTRLSLSDYSPTHFQLSEFLSDEHSIASTVESAVTSDLSDSFLECQDECCQCQTGISTEDDFREELKSISRHVIEAGEKSGGKRRSSSLKMLFLDEEQGEMDAFGARLQVGDNKAVPLLVKVILRLRKHFFGGLKGPFSLKSLTPLQNKQFTFPEEKTNGKKITFSPDAMLLSAVGESSASEIRDVMERVRVDVNKLSPSGKSLLHKAAASGNLESIHTLIQYGAKVNLPDEDGFVPVHAALRRCHYKCAIFLMECGTDMTAYTRARIQEMADINNMARAYKKTVLNTAL